MCDGLADAIVLTVCRILIFSRLHSVRWTTARTSICDMADPVSLAAAAAGFIGLAGQLAQGVVKLNEIRTTMNDAPRDLSNLCSSMDLLRNLLDDLGAQIQTSTHATIETHTLRDVVSRCEESRYRLEAHVNNIARKTKTAAMKYLFKLRTHACQNRRPSTQHTRL